MKTFYDRRFWFRFFCITPFLLTAYALWHDVSDNQTTIITTYMAASFGFVSALLASKGHDKTIQAKGGE